MILFSFILLSLTAQSAFPTGVIPPNLEPKAPIPSKVLATVDGVEIRTSDIEPMIWQIFHKQVEQEYIDYLIVANAAKALHVTVTDEEVQAGVDDLHNALKQQLQPGQTIEEALAQKDFSDSRLFMRVRANLLLEKIQLQTLQPGNWVKVSTLIFPTPGSDAQILKDALDKAIAAYDKLEKGASWDQLLSQSGASTQAIQTKGSIGWKPLDAFPESVRLSLQKLKAGEYTKPVQTINGIQIFRLDMQGASATGQDLKALHTTYIGSTKAETIKKIKAESKVVEEP